MDEKKEYIQEIKEAMEARSVARQRVASPKPETDLPATSSATSTADARSVSKASKHSERAAPPSRTSRTSRSAKSGTSSVGSQRVKIESKVQLDERGLRYVNLSTQGIPSVPKSIFSHKDVGTLDLSGNNLREIPREICELKTLFKLDLSRNGIRCMHSQDFKGLPAEMVQLRNLEILNLSECNFAFIPPVVWQLESLKYLNISRNKINLLVPEVGNLINLKTLDVQQANLNSLPSEIAYCQELEELLLWGNTIERLPETLKDLPCLKKLAINCRSFAAIVDQMDGMEEMLRTGERTSGYIPPVLFELSCLHVLDLSETKINWLPDTCNAKLNVFYLNKNFFRKVPQMVYTIETLQMLDLSNNRITELPDEISCLTKLTTLRMNDNSLEILPNKLCELENLTELSVGGNKLKELPNDISKLAKLKTLILDRNKITNLSDLTPLEELETLDLTDNMLENLPVSFYRMKLKKAHCYRKYSKYGLWLHKNPLKTPPERVWKTEEPENIYNYLRKLEIRLTENLQLQKLIVIGSWQSGKSSLIKTLISGNSCLTEAMVDSTGIMDYTLWTTENNVKFNAIELGGHHMYCTLHPMLMDKKAMYLLIYDHSTLNEHSFQKDISNYLEMIALFAPKGIVKLIGTKCDLLSPEEQEEKLDLVRTKLSEHQQTKMNQLNEEIHKREKQISKLRNNMENNMTKLLVKQLHKLEAMSQDNLKIDPNINLTSCSIGIQGMVNLISDLEVLGVNKNLFPQAQRFIPDYWREFSSELKQQKGVYLTWKRVATVGRRHEMRNELLTACMNFLTDTGEILWFPNNEALRDIVFHRPRELIQILRCVYRHDQTTFFTYEQNKIWQHAGGFTPESYKEAKDAFFKWGQVSRDMLLGLFFYLKIDNKLDVLPEILPKLDVCYMVPQADIPPRRGEFFPLMVIPSNNIDKAEPNQLDLQLQNNDLIEVASKEVTVEFTFPMTTPQGLFEKFSCRLQSLLDARIDWNDMIYGEVGSTIIAAQSLETTTEKVVKMTVKGKDNDMVQICCSFLCQNFYNLMSDCPGLIWYLDYTTKNDTTINIEECFPSGLFETVNLDDYRQTPKTPKTPKSNMSSIDPK